MSIINVQDQSNEGTILFFDDFIDEELDRSKWNVGLTGKVVNNEQQAYIDSPETIYILPDERSLQGNHFHSQAYSPGHEDDTRGVLVLHPRWKPDYFTAQGQKFDFVSGRIDTRGKVELTYGSISARVKLPVGNGLWPAFWLLGAGIWPACGEIDIMEYVGEPDWVNAAVHGPGYSGDMGLVNNHYFSAEKDATAWHIYEVNWMPGIGMVFKIDNELVYRVTHPMVENFGKWVFDGPKHIIINFALGGYYPYKINGVQQPYYGIPEETVQKIQQDQVRLLVDWVKATRLTMN